MRCDMRREFGRMVGEFEVLFKDRLKADGEHDQVDVLALMQQISAFQNVGFQSNEDIGPEETHTFEGRIYVIQKLTWTVLTAKEVTR